MNEFLSYSHRVRNSSAYYDNGEEILEKCITVVGYSLSMMAISIHVFVHFTTDLFKNFPGNLLISNCILLFVQYVCSMIFLMLEKAVGNSLFNRQSLNSYNSYITIYIWSVLTRVQFAMALDLWKCLRSTTTNIRLSSNRAIKFAKYTVCCWCSPFLEWAVLWLLMDYGLKAYFRMDKCRGSLNEMWCVFMIYFLFDFAIMIFNISLYVCCLYHIYRTKSSVKNAIRQKSNFLFYVKICGRLFIMSEVNYTLLIFVDHFQYRILKYVFYSCMAYHGTVVFTTIILQKSLLKYKSVKTDSENTAMMTNVTG